LPLLKFQPSYVATSCSSGEEESPAYWMSVGKWHRSELEHLEYGETVTLRRILGGIICDDGGVKETNTKSCATAVCELTFMDRLLPPFVFLISE